MSLLGLLLFAALQGPVSAADIDHAGSSRRPYGRLAEPNKKQLVAALQDSTESGETRLMALELLAYRSEPVSYEAILSVKRLVRGPVLVDYARLLGLSGPRGVQKLEAMKRHRRADVRAEVYYALVRLREDGESLGRQLLRNRKENPMVRVAALRALADRESPFANVEALRRLSMEEGPLLYECLSVLRRDLSEDHIPALIELLGASTGRAANEAVAMLQAITGYRIANDYKTWKHFFLKHKANATAFRREPDPDSQAVTLSYMGIPIYSDRVVFVLDSSSSMNADLPDQTLETRGSKAVKEFVQLLPRLPSTAQFNVIFFDSDLREFREKMVPVSQSVLAAATSFVENNRFAGATNLFGGLDRAFADAEVEEIVLLSDGSPSTGELTAPIPILARVVRWNRWRNARISTISFGAPVNARAFLYRLAMENRGSFRVIN